MLTWFCREFVILFWRSLWPMRNRVGSGQDEWIELSWVAKVIKGLSWVLKSGPISISGPTIAVVYSLVWTNRRKGLMTRGVMILYDKAQPHILVLSSPSSSIRHTSC